MSTAVHVMLVEDHTLMREGIKSLLAGVATVKVALEAANGTEALRHIASSPPDVVLLDINLPDMDGIQVARSIRSKWPDVRVVILSMYTDSHYIHEALEAGAAGYLTKSVSRAELLDTITLVMQGQTVLPRSAAHMIFSHKRPFRTTSPEPLLPGGAVGRAGGGTLSDREREVLGLLAEGCSTLQIGQRLRISPKTVKTHLQRIYGKLKVSDRLQAVMQASRLGVI